MPTDPALTLDTLAPERQWVRIKTSKNRRGQMVEIKTREDFSLAEQAQLARMEVELAELQPHVDAYMADGDMAEPDERIDRFERVIEAFIRIAYRGMPEEALAELKLPHKLQLMEVFTVASPSDRKAAAKPKAKGSSRSSRASRSRASSASTAATPAAGSRSPRGS